MNQKVTSLVRYLIVLVLIVATLTSLLSISGFAADLAVPAQLETVFQMPGYGNQLLRPSRIHVDNKYHEVFVADRGTNRILIFTPNGILKHEIYAVDLFGSPVDYDVDQQGKIYIIGTTKQGHSLFIFDFDGVLLQQHLIKELLPTSSEIEGISIDSKGQLFLIDKHQLRIIVLDQNLQKVNEFPIVQDMDVSAKDEIIIGDMRIQDDIIYLPVATLGNVFLYHTNGNLIRVIGYKGVLVGQLSFPVSVAVTKDNVICVLDKSRFMTLCYSQDGKFLGEFGGKGYRAGWFYHPSWIAADNEGNVYIGQTFKNMVQKCRIPDFIFKNVEKLSQIEKKTTVTINIYTPTINLHKGNISLNFGGFKHA